MKSDLPPSLYELSAVERRVLQAIHEISYGVVEVVIHERKVAEIRQTRRIRDVQENHFRTGQPEEESNSQQNNDCFYRVVRTKKDTTT